MHVEVPTANKVRTYAALGKVFSDKSKVKVHGMDLRLVPTYKREYTSHRKKKILRLVSKQNHFLNSSISTVTTCDFEDIDYYDTTLQTSMRNIIVELETIEAVDGDNQYPKLFLSIDYSDYHGGHVIAYPSYLSKQATDLVPQMPAFLHHLYGDQILTLFKPDAAALAIEEPWDPAALKTISKIDINLDNLAGSAYDWLNQPNNETQDLDIESMSKSTIDSAKIRTGNFLFKKATDAESVSTFASKRDPAQRAIEDSFQQHKKRKMYENANQNEADSDSTSVTKNTLVDSDDDSTINDGNITKITQDDYNIAIHDKLISDDSSNHDLKQDFSDENSHDDPELELSDATSNENEPDADSSNEDSSNESHISSSSNSELSESSSSENNDSQESENEELIDKPAIIESSMENSHTSNVSHNENHIDADTISMTEDREPQQLEKGVLPEHESVSGTSL